MIDIKCSMGKSADWKSIESLEFYFWNLFCTSPVTFFSLNSFLTHSVGVTLTTIIPITFVE